jgi:Threonine dehydrogenase and related Zn-dependent dehydrogenases
MKSAKLYDPNSVEISEQEQPEPTDDELLVEINACGVCTTDLHMYTGGRHRRLSDDPRPRERWRGGRSW